MTFRVMACVNPNDARIGISCGTGRHAQASNAGLKACHPGLVLAETGRYLFRRNASTPLGVLINSAGFPSIGAVARPVIGWP